MPFSTLRRAAAWAAAVPTALLLSGNAMGAETYLEEIVVTGTKRDISQQETPIAVSTLTADQIDKTFANDIRGVSDLSPNVNLTQQTGFNALAGGIRGTGTISILVTQDPSVGILVDEFALNHVQTQLVELFDIQQVEIYRGPQGTLFGKNSTGGVIAITSKRPDLQEVRRQVKLSAGTYDGGDDNYKINVGVDVPLIEDKLGLRFAGTYTNEDGYYENSKSAGVFPDTANVPIYAAFGVAGEPLPPELDTTTVGAGENLGGKDTFASKVKLLWQPNDNVEGYFLWEVIRDDSDSPPGVNETPAGEGFLFELLGFPGIQQAGHSDPFETGVTQQGNGINIRDGHQVEVDGYYMNWAFDIDNFTIKSITGYREQEETLPSTYTGEAFLSLFDATRNLEREQFQQEFRLISDFDGPFNFVAGGIFITDDLNFRSYATVGLTAIIPAFNATTESFLDERGFINLDLRNITNDPTTNLRTQDRESWAAYIDGTWDINDQWSVSAGARYTNDEKDFSVRTQGGGACNEFTEPQDILVVDGVCTDLRSTAVSRAGLTGLGVDQRNRVLPDENFGLVLNTNEEWNETTWRVAVDYQFSDAQMVYGSIATGFLAGGFSETCSQIVTCIPYDPEKNTNYEIGWKADLLDNRLRLNIAAFYTEFEDLQRNQVFAFTNPDGSPGQETITLNAGESTSTGVEVEATWLVNDNLMIRGSLGWLDAEYDEFEFDPDPTDPAVLPVDLSGLDIPFASELQVGAEAIYEHTIDNGAAMSWIVGVHYQDEAETSPFDPNAVNTGVARHPTFTQMEDRTLVNASVTYASPDERWYATLYGRNLTNEEYRTTSNSVGALWNFTMYGAPRQYGLEVGVNFY